MSEVVIHGSPLSTFVRTVRMTCHEKGVAYRVQEVDWRSADYRRLHPFNRMPAMTHGEVILFEGAAICRYVDEAFPGKPLQPGDVVARARMTQWISAINDYIVGSMIRKLVFQRFIAPMLGQKTDEAVIKAALPEIERHLDIIDGALAEDGWLAGNTMTLADLFLAPILYYVAATPEGGPLLKARANIQAAGAKVMALASYQATMPPLPKAAE